MHPRPRSITIISWVFIVFGSISLIAGLVPLGDITFAQWVPELKAHWMVHLARIIAVVAGVFMLYGRNWARWLLVIWMVFHLVIGALHSVTQLLLHVAIFAVILYFVFRRQASAYFLPANTRYV
jgi:hypothetical protein